MQLRDSYEPGEPRYPHEFEHTTVGLNSRPAQLEPNSSSRRTGSFACCAYSQRNGSADLGSVEEGLNHLPVVPKQVTTPTGDTYDGVAFEGKVRRSPVGPV